MIRIETADRGGKVFDEIVLELGDLAFRRQVTCDRDVMLAHRLSEELGVSIADHRKNKAYLKGFGITINIGSGSRNWFVSDDGVKRWADTGEPVE